MIFEIYEIVEPIIIAKSQFSFIFPNYKPIFYDHLLVVPKQIKERVFELSDEECGDLFLSLRNAIKALKYKYVEFSVKIQDGRCAGQTVFHVHAHIIPKIDKEFPNNKVERTLEAMKNDVEELKPYFERYF